MCKRDKKWVTVLRELGYNPYLIEKSIRTSSGSKVKTDIIASSAQLIHSLVFEIKGGITVKQDQLDRYAMIDSEDLYRWSALPAFTRQTFRFDWCVTDWEENHPIVAALVKDVPIITFGAEYIEKTGQFRNSQLNNAFSQRISLVGKSAPTLYYPFSEYDHSAYIARFVIQGLLQVASKKPRNEISVFDENLVTHDEILKYIFNPVYDALSDDHKGNLKDKIKEVIRWIMADEKMKDAFGSIEQQGGYKLKRHLDKLRKASNQFLANLETQGKLDSFL
jgi:hypothetical protein